MNRSGGNHTSVEIISDETDIEIQRSGGEMTISREETGKVSS
jgi:hypothetical protein